MITAGIAKVGLSLTALFVFGGVCGYVVALHRLRNPAVRVQLEERWIENRRHDDATRLKLTPEQQELARPTYQRMLTDIREVREAATTGLVEASRRQSRSLWPQLTPEQQQEYQRMLEERRVQFQKKGSS